MAKAPSEPFRPQIFGKFFLLQKLGSGGMAEIFRGKAAGAVGFEKELVIKRILPELSRDKQFVRMLVNEAKLTVALTHPAIAQVYELGEVDGQFFISMELVEGVSLHELMHTARQAKRPLTIEQSLYVCLEVLRALDYAHKRTDGAGTPLGIVHCDVSPDNVMVTWDGRLKLLDFGVARAAQSSLSNYREGTLMGKLSYAAPEQAEGEWFDHRVDLFAVGVMLYELLTGQHPFGRVKTIEALRASRKKIPARPSEVAPGLPPLLDDFVLKALAYRREDRFQSAREMADQLVDFLFPTPIVSVQEHLAATVAELFRARIEKQQRIRANDPLHMKVLANARAMQEQRDRQRASQQAAPSDRAQPFSLPPDQGTRIFVSSIDPNSIAVELDLPPEPTSSMRIGSKTAARPLPPAAHPQVAAGRTWRRSLLAALLGCAVGCLATWLWLGRSGPTLVVLSEPPGAEVFLAEQSLGKTPLVLEDAPIPAEGAELQLRLADHRTARVLVVGGGRVVRAEAQLVSSLGRFRVESDPPGARVALNGEPVGTTPLVLENLPMDRQHRFDLERRGYEIDSFIVLPDEVGPSIRRQLVPLQQANR